MKTNKITIHRALAELKVIDSRIGKAIDSFDPIILTQREKGYNRHVDIESFPTDTKASYQSIKGLIARKAAIKSAIVESNSVTMVTILEEKYSVADAITHKTIIEHKRSLLDVLKAKFNSNLATYNVENEKINSIAIQNALVILGKDSDATVKKSTDEDVKAITEPFIKRNELKILDPLGIEELIKTLDTSITAFELEVDAVLSESNAITFIEV